MYEIFFSFLIIKSYLISLTKNPQIASLFFLVFVIKFIIYIKIKGYIFLSFIIFYIYLGAMVVLFIFARAFLSYSKLKRERKNFFNVFIFILVFLMPTIEKIYWLTGEKKIKKEILKTEVLFNNKKPIFFYSLLIFLTLTLILTFFIVVYYSKINAKDLNSFYVL